MSLTAHSKSLLWISYVAIVWWFAFAAVSFYWAAGGTFALNTLGERIESLAATGELWVMSLVAVTGVLKLIPALLVLSLIRPWGDRFPLKIRLWTVAGSGILSFLYGGVQMVAKLLVLAGLFTPEEIDSAGFWGHLLIWDPVWIVGGTLLGAVAWSHLQLFDRYITQ
jgi:hypothetical protein